MAHEDDQIGCRLENDVETTGGQANALVPGEVQFLGHEGHPQLQEPFDGYLDTEGVVVTREPLLRDVWHPFNPSLSGRDGTFVVD